MSLLNDALREAEERQHRPEVTGAYTGAVEQGRRGQPWLMVLILLLLLGLASAGVYWFVGVDDTPVEVVQGQVEREVKTIEEVTESEMPAQPEPVQAVSESEPEPGPEPEKIAEPEQAPEPEQSVEPEQPAEPAQVAEPKPALKQRPVDVAAVKKPEPEAEPESEPEAEQAPAIKTPPQSPGAIDRQLAKQLESLIASGRMVEAERRLNDLTLTQPAPRSRFAVARALLVDGEALRALDWLPEAVTANDATLRMLRARALHADGRLDAAIATLESRVPGVSEQTEYRVTLATLLQQQGQNEKAASHWAELIAWDDSRAPWWVGLAIALEDRGELRGATRAYEQAAALPGLPPSLADYVQRRLQSLRAG